MPSNAAPSYEFPKTILKPKVASQHGELVKQMEPDIQKFIKLGRRDPLLFDWVLRVMENLGLSTVEPEYHGRLAVIKTTFSLWEVLLDDLADNEDTRNLKLFDEFVKIPLEPEHINESKLDTKELNYLRIGKEIWENSVMGEIKKLPKYEKYKEALEFDLLQFINSMKYSRFVNNIKDAANIIETEVYVHHSMYVLIQMDLDLMCSKGFNDSEFGMLREVGYITQKMAKIGNLLGTYPRELLETDMSSEAVIKFMEEHGSNFKFKLNKILNKESRYPLFEEKLIEEWQKEYQMAKEIVQHIKSVDMDSFMKEREFIQEAYLIKITFW
ncbi:MAG: hypothetical protein KGH94_03190 [Candidatus Micrarchaeota archaeon]|nr:hypothetical protein [Candidatus Micrarchaeota archaeon]